MKQLGKIKLLPCEIIRALASNMELQKLLIVDAQDMPTDEQFKSMNWAELIEQNYMSIVPVVDDNITNNSRNTFLIVHLDEINAYGRENNIEVNGNVYIGTNLDHCWLKGNKLRLLEMIDEIVKTLDNKKFSVAGTLGITRASAITYSKKSFGYRINFRISEQENRKAEL